MVYLQTTLRDGQSNNAHLATATVSNHELPFHEMSIFSCFPWGLILIGSHQVSQRSRQWEPKQHQGSVFAWYSKAWQWCQTDKCSVDLFLNKTQSRQCGNFIIRSRIPETASVRFDRWGLWMIACTLLIPLPGIWLIRFRRVLKANVQMCHTRSPPLVSFQKSAIY